MAKSEKETADTAAEMQSTKIEAKPEAPPEALVPEVPRHEIESIIRKRVYGAMGVGLAPIPLLDLAGITAIQVEMVRALAKRYDVPFRPELARSIISSLVGGVVPVAAAPVVASLAKFIPVIGWTTAGVSMSLTGGAMTYALGHVFVSHFEKGGVLPDFDVKKMSGVFKSKLKEGKEVASEMKQERAANA